MICSNCGHPLESGKVFCENCGHYNTVSANAPFQNKEIKQGKFDFYSTLASFMITITLGQLGIAQLMGTWTIGLSEIFGTVSNIFFTVLCIFAVLFISKNIGGKASGIVGLAAIIFGFIGLSSRISWSAPGYLLSLLLAYVGIILFAATIFHRSTENIPFSTYMGIGIGVISMAVMDLTINRWFMDQHGFSSIFLATSALILFLGIIAIGRPGSFPLQPPSRNVAGGQRIVPVIILFTVPFLADFVLGFLYRQIF